jgi:peptidyl-prolyl cis-trans isomerase B (cyclophilin B)
MSLPRVAFDIVQGDEDWGRIVLELEAEKTPKTTENFLRYVDAKFFDGTIFHRVMPDFMIQGGGYTAPGEQKAKGLKDPVENEAAKGLKNVRGTIAMARTNEPHSATSQFFINVKDNSMLDHPGSDGWGYCAFGRVVEGIEIVDRIKDVETTDNAEMGEKSQPANPPKIKKAARL